MSWRKACPGCGNGYEAKKETSKYCSGTCRQRVFRAKRRERLKKQFRMEVDPIEKDLVAYGFSPAQIARLRRMAMDHYDTVKMAIARYDRAGWILWSREKGSEETDTRPRAYADMAKTIRNVDPGQVGRRGPAARAGGRTAGERAPWRSGAPKQDPWAGGRGYQERRAEGPAERRPEDQGRDQDGKRYSSGRRNAIGFLPEIALQFG